MERLGEHRSVPLPDGRTATIGPIGAAHVEDLQLLFAQIVAAGEGYPQTPPLTRPAFEEMWVRPVTITVAATVDGDLAGAYYLKPNQPGLGAHIANAGYVVGPRYRGQRIGTHLITDSIDRAPIAGFDAIQFNFVFESNPARATYERLGWREIGRVPDAVPAAGGGRQAALLYWRAVGSNSGGQP
jgi:GNAT superfamily N-acetyltransferase